MPTLNKENFYWLPILKEEIWDALQAKNYPKAEQELETALKTIPPLEWVNTFWIGIIGGYPFLRANLNEEEWSQNVLPIVAKAVLNTATGEALVNVFRNLDIYPETLKSFNDLFVEIIPGENKESKIEWIKKKKSSLYIFLTANPAQELGVNLIKLPQRQSVKDASQRYKTLPLNIKNAIMSYATAEDIFRTGTVNHLSDEKISSLATITGQVLMGLIHFDDIEKTIQETLNIDGRLATQLNQILNEKIFSRFRNEIRDIYDPIITPVDAEVVPENKKTETVTIPLETLSEDKLIGEKILPVQDFEESKNAAPLIIHEESKLPPEFQKIRPLSKGFSLPFRFFKPKTAREDSAFVKAEVEVPRTMTNNHDDDKRTMTAIDNDKPITMTNDNDRRKKDLKRVVHYSEYRSPIMPLPVKEEVIDLEKLAFAKNEENPQEEREEQKSVKLEGNTVDLRNKT